MLLLLLLSVTVLYYLLESVEFKGFFGVTEAVTLRIPGYPSGSAVAIEFLVIITAMLAMTGKVLVPTAASPKITRKHVLKSGQNELEFDQV